MDDDHINQSLLTGRSTTINYQGVEHLFYLGNYTRRLSVSLTRMMENAYDWEHLPFIHSSTFHHISLVEEGDWGWRAEVGSAKSNGDDKSMLELLVDAPNHYWATTVVSGTGKGVEIHTQATAVSDKVIDIDVRFYSPKRLNWVSKFLGLSYLRRQYRKLYDEDSELMQDRQSAVDDKKRWRGARVPTVHSDLLLVGAVNDLSKSETHVLISQNGRYCATYLNNRWHAYSAVCPHQLGKLDAAQVDQQGQVTCPWHGYQFDISDGENLDGKCAKLPVFETVDQDGKLFIRLA